jgi:cobyrinic acid a,c-diamide synthase
MAQLPRLVLASVSEQEEPSISTLAVMAALRGCGYQVQHFRARASFDPIDYVTPLTGIASRHLDPWIMSTSLTRELFARSAAHADVSIIEGAISPVAGGTGDWSERVRQVAEILNAPVIGVIRSQPSGVFHATCVPSGLNGLFIEGFASREQYAAEKGALEGMFGLPVLGGMPAGSAGSRWVQSLLQARRIPGTVVDEWRRSLLELTDLDRLLQCARSQPFPAHEPELFAGAAPERSLRVAVGYDDCFHCYFPDTLDALEYLGAELCQFSPRVDGQLPEGTDIVYLGCGHPQRFACELAENECMSAALREHVCSGRRVYAEGGGMAYLCQQMHLPDGTATPMVGVLPADAHLAGSGPLRPEPVVVRCECDTWIAGKGQTIRGYHNGAWRLEPRPGATPCFLSGTSAVDGLVRHHCLGSTVHLNFAAQPRVLRAFFAPHAPSLSVTRRSES